MGVGQSVTKLDTPPVLKFLALAVALMVAAGLVTACQRSTDITAADGGDGQSPAVDSSGTGTTETGDTDSGDDDGRGSSMVAASSDGSGEDNIPLTSGVAADFVDLTGFPAAPPQGSLILDGCRWVDPLTWVLDGRWEPASDTGTVDLPVYIRLGTPDPVSHDTASQDTDSHDTDSQDTDSEESEEFGGSPNGYKAGMLTLTGAGSFSVRIDQIDYISMVSLDEPGIWVTTPILVPPPSGTCQIEVIADEEWSPRPATDNNSVAVTVDRVPNPRDLPDDTVEALAAAVDPTDPDDPMLALLRLVEFTDLPVDVLYLAPDIVLNELTVVNFDGCVRVESSYGFPVGPSSGDGGGVSQFRGCQGPDDGDALIQDGPWTVTVDGSDQLTRTLKRYRFLGSVPVDQAPSRTGSDQRDVASAGAGDPDAELDAFDWGTEVGRLDWQDQRVGVFADLTQDYCCVMYEVVVAGPDDFNPGSQGMACRDWSIALYNDSVRGFALVVVDGDRTADVTINGQTVPVDLQPSAVENRSVAVVDMPVDFTREVDFLSGVTVYEADGSISPCVQ